MKQNEILLFLLFHETIEISQNNFFVSLFFVFRKTKKGCEMETLVWKEKTPRYAA
jgi:hypothetical protein